MSSVTHPPPEQSPGLLSPFQNKITSGLGVTVMDDFWEAPSQVLTNVASSSAYLIQPTSVVTSYSLTPNLAYCPHLLSSPLPPLCFTPFSLTSARAFCPLLFLLSPSPPSHSLPPARALLSSSSSLLHPLLSHPCPRVLSSPPLHLHLYRRGFGSSRQTCTRRPHLHRRRQWRGSRNQLRRSRRQLRRGPVLPR